MSELDVIGRMEKRRCYAVDVGDGESVYVRALTIDEVDRLAALPKEHKTGFVMGCALTDANRMPVFHKGAEEDDTKFAARVMAVMKNVSTENLSAVSEAIGKIGKTPKADALKNS